MKIFGLSRRMIIASRERVVLMTMVVTAMIMTAAIGAAGVCSHEDVVLPKGA